MVIVVSARRQEQDKIETLGLGADDYVTKPFSPMELIARIQANLRRHRPNAARKPEVVRLNDLILDMDGFTLQQNGEKITLTQVKCELLHLFMRNPDRVMTKREIYQHVWKHENYDDNNLIVFVNRLRKLLDDSPTSPQHLQTIRGIGYRFSVGGS